MHHIRAPRIAELLEELAALEAGTTDHPRANRRRYAGPYAAAFSDVNANIATADNNRITHITAIDRPAPGPYQTRVEPRDGRLNFCGAGGREQRVR